MTWTISKWNQATWQNKMKKAIWQCQQKRPIWKVLIKWNTKLNSYIIQLSINAERKFQIKTIELPINKGFSYEKRGGHLEKKTLPILCQNKESSLKFTRIPLFIKAYSYFFKSKWGFSFNLVRDQANGPCIKSNTFNYSFNLETSNHESRSSFLAPSDRNVSWRSNQRNLLSSFIVKIYTEDCTHIYINQYKLIICYTISWSCDSSFTKIVCTMVFFIYLYVD